MSKRYTVNSPIKSGGAQYHPDDADMNTIELTDKEAKPLLATVPPVISATSVVVVEKTEPEGPSEPLLDTNHNAVIRQAIKSLDKDDAALWTNDHKANTKVLSEIVGFKVSAAERDAATESKEG